jgi:hypothetical protein
MATTSQKQSKKQQKKTSNMKLSPEQDIGKKQEAQDLLHHLQKLLADGDSPTMDILNETLQRVEQLAIQTSRQSHVDPETSKTLEDISTLLLTARKMAKNKGVADSLQRIADESQLAIKTRKGDVATSSKEMSQDFMEFMNAFRPLFFLLISSKDFRLFILDAIKIAKRVVYSYSDVSGDAQHQFIEGGKPKEMANNLRAQIKEKGAPELTDEEWDRIQDDLQRVLSVLAREPSFRQGVEKIFHLLDMFQTRLQREDAHKQLQPKDPHIQKVVGEAEALVSNFSGRETLNQFKFYLKRLIRKSSEDEDLHNYLHELKQFILSTKDEDEVRTEEFRKRIKVIARRGRRLMREFKEDDDALRPFLKSSSAMIDNIKNDEFLQLLRHHAGIVQSDLSYVDNNGKIQVDTDMLGNLQRVLLPVLADALKYIPIPKISNSDRKAEFMLDKIVLCSYDIIPENIKFHLETTSEFSLQHIEVRGTRTFLIIQLNQLLTEVKDVDFYFKKKTFPTFEDSGRVTFRIKGQGAQLTFTYNVEHVAGDSSPRIIEGHADFFINQMDIEFDKETLKHDLLIPVFTKIFKNMIKKKIEEAVEKNLKSFIAKLGGVMTNAISQVNRPLLTGLEMARKNIKASELSQLYQKRREKLE